jgi:hypothetical protein
MSTIYSSFEKIINNLPIYLPTYLPERDFTYLKGTFTYLKGTSLVNTISLGLSK